MSRYVFVIPNPEFARHRHLGYVSNHDEAVFRYGAAWARQLDRRQERSNRGDDVDVQVFDVGAAPVTHGSVLMRTSAAIARAAEAAGPGGVVALLMGHGGAVSHACMSSADALTDCPPYWRAGTGRRMGNSRFGVQLAPSGHLNVTQVHIEVIREMRRLRCSRPMELRVIEHIGEVLSMHRIARVDFYSCEMGQGGSDGLFLDNLHNLWGVRLRGLRGTVVLTESSQGQRRWYSLHIEGRDGRNSPRYRRSHPSDEWWYSSSGVYERPIQMPGMTRSRSCDDF